MTLFEKINSLRKVITVEPIIIIFTLVFYCSIIIEHQVYKYLNYEKVWISGESNLVRVLISSICTLLFLGSYSDHHNLRKPFLLLPLVGQLIFIVLTFVCSRQEERCTNNVFNIIKIISKSFGESFMLPLMAYSYVADITDQSTRTFRFAVLHSVDLNYIPLLFIFIQNFFDQDWISRNITVWILVNGILLLATIFYTIFWLPGPNGPTFKQFLDSFNPRHFLKTIKTLIVQRPKRGRSTLWILFSVVFVNGCVSSINIWYSSGLEKFKHGLWSYSSLTLPILALTVIIIFINILRLSDLVVLLVNFACLSIANTIFGFAENQVTVYMGQTFYCPNIVLASAVCGAMLTKTVSKEEYGKVIALMYLCALLPYYIPILISYFGYYIPKSFCYYSMAALCIAFLPVLWWIRARNKRLVKEEAETVVHNNEDNYRTSAV